MKTYGRTTIYANYSEEELLTASDTELQKIVIDILTNSKGIHDINRNQTAYLFNYFNGKQDIYVEKQKVTRKDIDNKTVENWAYALIDFKEGWLLGKSIQYSLQGNRSSNEITALNNYCSNQNKKIKDRLLYEDMLVCGRGFRFIESNEDKEEAPFKIINIDPDCCEVVYSSGVEHEQLLSYIKMTKKYIFTNKSNKNFERYYDEYTVYTRRKVFVVSNKGGNLKVIDSKDNIINEHRITEYYLNRKRISLIELGKDLFNDVNYLESMDKDDMEQFVNALLIFTNAEIDGEDVKEFKDIGAICISSTAEKPSKVEALDQRLNANSTSTYYSRLINALHQILGVPKAGDNGEVSYGDTGQARLTGQGYTSAGIRAYNDETIFESCDLNSLKTILKFCKEKESKIKKLKTIDIKINFQRDMSDGLLTKTQALQTLYESKVPREIANAIVGLFPDPNIVTNLQTEIYGKEGQVLEGQEQTKNKSIIDKVKEQNNKLQDINQKAIQGA